MQLNQIILGAEQVTVTKVTPEGITTETVVRQRKPQGESPTPIKLVYDGQKITQTLQNGLQRDESNVLRQMGIRKTRAHTVNQIASKIMCNIMGTPIHNPLFPQQRTKLKYDATICCACERGSCDVRYCSCFKNGRYCVRNCNSKTCKNVVTRQRAVPGVSLSMKIQDFQTMMISFNPVTAIHPNDPQHGSIALKKRQAELNQLQRQQRRQQIMEISRQVNSHRQEPSLFEKLVKIEEEVEESSHLGKIENVYIGSDSIKFGAEDVGYEKQWFEQSGNPLQFDDKQLDQIYFEDEHDE